MEAVRLSKLEKRYPGVHALKGISLAVPDGGFYGLLGPNGAGKTTTIGILTGLVNATGGRAEVFGKRCGSQSAKALIGLVPQEYNLSIFDKVLDILIHQAGYYGIPRKEAGKRAEEHLKLLGLWEKRDVQARFLSGGMKRKLMIARALLHKPRLLILDEPTAGVDVETRREMWAHFRRLNEGGVTVILTTHYIEEAEELCDRIGIIDHGLLVRDMGKKELLGELGEERYLLDVDTVPDSLPAGCARADATTITATVTRRRTLTAIIQALARRGVTVRSMRNERNRLEELFVRLTR